MARLLVVFGGELLIRALYERVMDVLGYGFLCICLVSAALADGPSCMPPSPHLPLVTREVLRGVEWEMAGRWGRDVRSLRDARALATGARQMPCLLIGFPDQSMATGVAAFQQLLFTPAGVSTGSARDYFRENSYGQFTLDGQVNGGYVTANARYWYGFGVGMARAATCAREAALAADAAGFDWAPYDNDHDGYVDSLWVVHSGLGAEESGSFNDIWSHAWDFTNAGVGEVVTRTPDPYHAGQYLRIRDYLIVPEQSCWAGGNGVARTTVGIGVFCHEFGHLLGLPDLYDTGGSGEGLGCASVMAGGAWGGDGNDTRFPAHLDAWSKTELGWLAPAVVSVDGDYTVTAAENAPSCYLVKPTGSSINQYFLVENRQHHGFDRTLFTTGLFIYHIDTNIISAYRTTNNVNTNTHAYGVALEEADTSSDSYAAMHLFTGANRGLATDSWPYGARTAFDASSIPSTRTNSGTAQNCGVTGIPASADAMTVHISVGLLRNEADVAPRPTGSGTLSVSDWVQVGRFVAGLDTIAPGSEFQRADCAPRDTRGNGALSVADWVQAGRYAVALDPPVAAGGANGAATATAYDSGQ